MKRVCAWCGRELDQPERSDGGQVTHGVCQGCRCKFFASAKLREVDSRSSLEDVGDAHGIAGGHTPTDPSNTGSLSQKETDMTGQSYPEYHSHLRNLLGKLGKDLQGPMAGFGQLHKAAVADGALSGKIKELIALAIAVNSRCEGCIAFHTHDALRAGASRSEILESLGIAVLMGGGPAAMYACEALEALEQFQAAPK
jgi:AhpD family alkylhydroperoxidase